MSMKAIVKSVMSGDSLVLRGRPGPQGQLPKERILHLADLSAPRLGNSTRDDEPWAFESRDYLRALTVGKEISFISTHSLPPTDEVSRDLGTAEIGGLDLTSEILKNGWAKKKELKREPTEEDTRHRELEADAKAAGKGIWNPHGPSARTVHHMMPLESQAFVTEHKGKVLDALVEQVRDGSTLRVRLYMPEGDHQVVNLSIAGVRCARSSGKPGESAEPWGDEAKFFVESRLLQRAVKVTIFSLPAPSSSPFQSNMSAPAPASIFIGTVHHPAGNIAELLIAAGLARVVDWHAGMLGSAMEKLRAAERIAKQNRACLYANTPVSNKGTTEQVNGHNASTSGSTFEATVIRVWSADTISVLSKAPGSKSRRLQLSSTRGPRSTDSKQAYFVHEAREFLRKKLIGKVVKVTIDFIRPKDGEFEARECATVRIGGQNSNVAEQLISKGLAGVVRHKRDDEDRSSDYDKLMAAEQVAVAEARGLHSGKEHPAPKQPLNISETNARATQFLNGFKRQGRVSGIVEYVASASRFKIFIPKDNQVLTLVLGGIKAPKTARNASEKSEPFGVDGAEFSSNHYMQRDVDIELDSVDKAGGFIGSLYLNKNENAAVSLLKEGLATVHSFTADTLPYAKQLYDAEKEAKSQRRNIWKDHDEQAIQAAELAAKKANDPVALKAEYLDVIISDVRVQKGFEFSIQILNTEGIASLERLMRDFSAHHRTVSISGGITPKTGELVSARFSDGSWYRAKIRRSSAIKKEAEVTFIDYGNQDVIPFSNLRPLDSKFRSLPPQAHDARLSFIKLLGSESEYHAEAVERFRNLCEGRKLIANKDYSDGTLLHLRLMDPSNPTSAEDPYACINADLLREGVASLDRRAPYLSVYPAVVKRLGEAVILAKRERLGMFEFGDVEEDD